MYYVLILAEPGTPVLSGKVAGEADTATATLRSRLAFPDIHEICDKTTEPR
jgi:hypothetical protein